MNLHFYLISSIALFLVLTYGLFIRKLYFLLSKNGANDEEKTIEEMCSIIIPFRNEENHLPALFESLLKLDYPRGKFEILLVDDHSTDKSGNLVLAFADKNPLMDICLLKNQNEYGKKKALAMGLSKAKNDIVLQTDADCIVPQNWIYQMMVPFENKEVKAVMGKVEMRSTGKVLEDLMALEFVSLQASGIGMGLMKLPIMSNAANLAYKKSQIPEKIGGENWETGDDAFLIQTLSKGNKNSVAVSLVSKVKTSLPGSLGAFFRQRLRWGSKTPDYPLKQGKWIAGLVFLLSLWQIFLLPLSLIYSPYWFVFWAIYLFKILPDFLLLKTYLANGDQQKLLRWIPLLAFCYPFYIVITALYLAFASGSLKWKGRFIRH